MTLLFLLGTEDELLVNEINKLLDYGVAVNIVMIENSKDNEMVKRCFVFKNDAR